MSGSRILGIDFTSAPQRRKAIAVANGRLIDRTLTIDRIESLCDFGKFEEVLARPGPWIGGFDFPFGLPREAVEALDWPATSWPELVVHCEKVGRAGFTSASDKLRISRPEGRKYPKRRGDEAAQSHSPMKCVRPPVGWMFVEGAPRLLRAGVCIPGMNEGDPLRVAVEAYPGFTARAIIGRRSYKNDQQSKWDLGRKKARTEIIEAMLDGSNLTGIKLSAGSKIRAQMLEDGTGDSLDAALCALQAGWAELRKCVGYGLPPIMDPLEGWIVTVPSP